MQCHEERKTSEFAYIQHLLAIDYDVCVYTYMFVFDVRSVIEPTSILVYQTTIHQKMKRCVSVNIQQSICMYKMLTLLSVEATFSV